VRLGEPLIEFQGFDRSGPRLGESITPITYNLAGTSTYADVVYQGTEQTTLTASQTQ
jgi:hypothetical protein